MHPNAQQLRLHPPEVNYVIYVVHFVNITGCYGNGMREDYFHL
jgi:hypothetical protein